MPDLTVNEQYVLYPLLRFGEHTKASLLTALEALEQSADDPFIRQDIRGLADKLSPESVSEDSIAQMHLDAMSGVLWGPMPYRLPEGGDGA